MLVDEDLILFENDIKVKKKFEHRNIELELGSGSPDSTTEQTSTTTSFNGKSWALNSIVILQDQDQSIINKRSLFDPEIEFSYVKTSVIKF